MGLIAAFWCQCLCIGFTVAKRGEEIFYIAAVVEVLLDFSVTIFFFLSHSWSCSLAHSSELLKPLSAVQGHCSTKFRLHLMLRASPAERYIDEELVQEGPLSSLIVP